ncbi:hypothetical protein TWF173_009019 [Orbilia oligospora]|nr:hypothetical protein TWF173_009019 [Orbilia oligospora]
MHQVNFQQRGLLVAAFALPNRQHFEFTDDSLWSSAVEQYDIHTGSCLHAEYDLIPPYARSWFEFQILGIILIL